MQQRNYNINNNIDRSKNRVVVLHHAVAPYFKLLTLILAGILMAYSSYYLLGSSTSCTKQATSGGDVAKNKNEMTEMEIELQSSSLHGGGGRDAKQQRIALMFGGAPRTMTQLGVMTSHVVNVIDALGGNGLDIVDVFFHINNGTMDGLHPSNNIAQHVDMELFTQALLDKLVQLMLPVQIILHTDGSCSGLNGALANHSCCNNTVVPEKWQKNFLQFGYLRESYRMAMAYEREKHITYDWFVRFRPDVACFEPLPAARSLSTRRYYLQTKERVHGMNTNDYIFIVPRNLANLFFEQQIMTIFEATCPTGESQWPAEKSMFTAWAPRLPYQVLPLACVHVMTPDCAQCSRLSRGDQPDIPAVFDIDGSLFDQGETFEQGCMRLVAEGYFGNNQSHV